MNTIVDELITSWLNLDCTEMQKKFITNRLKIDTDGITRKQAYELIENYNKNTKLDLDEIEHIKKIMTIDEINETLKDNVITDYNELTTGSLKKLLENNINLSFSKILKKYTPVRENIPIIYSKDHEIGISKERKNVNNFIIYFKFYDIMLLDYDNIEYDELIRRLSKYPKFLYKIYKTFNGYHVFIVSNKIEYNNEIAIDIAKLLECDPWYIVYFKNHGYCIRISFKSGRNEENWHHCTHKYIGMYGNGIIDIDIFHKMKVFEEKMTNVKTLYSFDEIFNNFVIKHEPINPYK